MKGWRTIIFNAVIAALAALDMLAPVLLNLMGMPEVQAIVPAAWRPWWVLVLALGNLWLRRVTTTPVGRSE